MSQSLRRCHTLLAAILDFTKARLILIEDAHECVMYGLVPHPSLIDPISIARTARAPISG